MKLLKTATIILVVVGAGWFGYSRFFTTSKQPVTYQTTIAKKGTLVVSVAASGKISSVNGVDVLTQATGVITTVYAKNGDTVKAGQKLASIQLDQDGQAALAKNYASYLSAKNSANTTITTNIGLEQAVLTAEQAVTKAEKDLITAQEDFAAAVNRSLDDPERKIAKLALESAHSAVDTAKMGLSVAQQKAGLKGDNTAISQANLNSVWLTYQQTLPTITAPMAGVLSNFALSAGNTISGSSSSSSSSSSQVVGTITLPGGQIQALVDLTEIDIVSVKTGQKATLTMDAFPGKTFTGKVVAINTNGSVSSNVTTYPTTIAFDDNPVGIYSNMAVDATIVTNSKTDVITISTSAITTIDGVSTVRIMKNGKPVAVAVTLELTSDSETEIVSGISEGDKVITATTTTSIFSGTGSRNATTRTFTGNPPGF